MKRLFSVLMLMLVTMATWAETKPEWTAPSPNDYPASTIISFDFTVNGAAASSNDNIEVAAFIDGVCRGVTTASSLNSNVGRYASLYVYGNAEDNGKDIELRTFVNSLQYKFTTTYKFSTEGRFGDLSELVHLAVIDLSSDVTYSMDDIYLDMETNPKSADLYSLLKVNYHTADGANVSTTWAELPAKPVNYTFFVQTQFSDYYGVSDNCISAKKATKKTGEGLTCALVLNYQTKIVNSTVYITPYDRLDTDVKIKLTDLTVPYGADYDIRNNLVFLFPDPTVMSYVAYEEVPYARLSQFLGYTPDLTFQLETYDWCSDYFENTNNMPNYITPLKRTDRKGIPVTVSGWGEGCQFAMLDDAEPATLRITPIDLFDRYTEMVLSNVTLEKGQTADLRDYISFKILKEDAPENPTESDYDVVKWDNLATYLGYNPDIEINYVGTYSLGADNSYIESDEDDILTITALKSTFTTGVNLYLNGLKGDVKLGAESKLFITPYDVFAQYQPTAKLANIEVRKLGDADLRDYITFEFTIDGNKETVAYKDLTTRFGYTPNFAVTCQTTETQNYRVVGFTLTGLKAVANDPISIVLAETDGPSFNLSATVTVTLDYTPLESITFSLPDELKRFETTRVPATVNPADAEYDVQNFKFTVTSGQLTFPNDWELADVRFVKDNGALYLEVTPYVAYPLFKLVASYQNEDTDWSSAGFFSVPADQSVPNGWSWCSFYGLLEETDLVEFDNDIAGDAVYDIRTQTTDACYDSKYGFFGSLTSVTNNQAYKLKTKAAADLTYNERAVVYSLNNSTEVVLYKGWTWVVYPYQYNHPLYDFGELLPKTSGNRVVSFSNGFAEANGTAWTGSLTELKYGESFLFYNAGETTRVTFGNEMVTLEQPDFSAAPSNRRAQAHSQWKYNASDYADNMTIVAEITNVPDAENYTIGAFVGDECRGEGKMVQCDDRTLVFITVHGKGGETVNFRIGDGLQEFQLNETVNFSAAAGSLTAPVPFRAPLVVPTAIATVETAPAAEAIYDLSGRRIAAPQQGVVIANGRKVLR